VSFESQWQRKQEALRLYLADHGAEEAPYRVDLGEQKIFWIDGMGLSLVVADCKVLLSYALSNRSVMMAWANSSLAPECGISEIEGVPPYYTDCEPEDVWELAVSAASAVDAEAIYRSPSPQSWVMLGLWNLRPGGAEQFYSGSPKEHVIMVLRRLTEHPSSQEWAVLLDNYAESFLQMAGHPHKGTEYEPQLRDTARDMRNLLGLAAAEERELLQAELAKLIARWEAVN
jgi:hypothetical protein